MHLYCIPRKNIRIHRRITEYECFKLFGLLECLSLFKVKDHTSNYLGLYRYPRRLKTVFYYDTIFFFFF